MPECVIKCGKCCRMDWALVDALTKRFDVADPEKHCPLLGPKGCTLPREMRPRACTWYLCKKGMEAGPLLKIKDLMSAWKLTQKRLAELAGLSQGYLSRFLSGQSRPGRKACIKLAKALAIPVVDLWGGLPEETRGGALGVDCARERYAKAKGMRQAGCTYEEIGKAFDVSRQRAHQLVQLAL